MRRPTTALGGALLLLGAACGGRVDVAAESRALLDADRAWARAASAGRSADSVLAYWTDDARVAMPGQPVVRGTAALRAMVTSSFATPGFHLTWTPESAAVARSGELGYTVGTSELTVPDGAGGTTRLVARYLTVWRKEGGRWRCAEDYASPAPTASAPAPAAAPGPGG